MSSADRGVRDAESTTRAIVHIFATGEVEAVSRIVADDYVDHQGLDGVEIRGQRGFARVVEAVHRSADAGVTVEDIVAADDKAAVRLRWRGVAPSGRAFVRETLDLLRFTDGRLAEHWGAELFRRDA